MIHLTLRKYCHRDFYEYYNATIRSLIIENNISDRSTLQFCFVSQHNQRYHPLMREFSLMKQI